MKITKALVAIVISTCIASAVDVTDPQVHYLSDYQVGDTVKKMTFDINGDGVADYFFAYIEANPDPTTRIANEQEGGSLSLDAYVSNPNTNTFRVCDTLEEQGSPDLLQGVAPLNLNPDQMYVGNISEINRVGIVTSQVKRAKAENMIVIYAYTWEGMRFKQWKLAEYITGKQNAIFDRYLADAKRTHVTLQQIKP